MIHGNVQIPVKISVNDGWNELREAVTSFIQSTGLALNLQP